MSTVNIAPKPTLSARLLTFALEALKLLGFAIAALALIGIAVIISDKFGINIPARWFGLFFWTGFLAWIICRQNKSRLKQTRFWAVFSAIILAHLVAFIGVLRAYPEWRMAWFPLAAIIEAPLMAMTLEFCLQRLHRK
jgi:amino acid permease